MNKYFSILLFILLSGCNYYTVKPVFNTPEMTDKQPNDFYIKGKNIINNTGTTFKTELKEAKNDKEKRNRLLSQIILLSDTVCAQHKGNILANSAKLNVGLGTLTTIFTSLGATLKGESTKSALSAAASITNSTKSLVNEEVYYNTFAIAIVKAIDMARETKRSAIYSNMKEDTSKYGVIRGISDINEYHNSCSFMNGLKLVSESIDKRKPTKDQLKQKMEELKKLMPTTLNGNSTLSPESKKELESEFTNLFKQYSREF